MNENERMELATIVAGVRGDRQPTPIDFLVVDRIMASGFLLEHDRNIAIDTVRDVACKIPDTVDALLYGESATHWLDNFANEMDFSL